MFRNLRMEGAEADHCDLSLVRKAQDDWSHPLIAASWPVCGGSRQMSAANAILKSNIGVIICTMVSGLVLAAYNSAVPPFLGNFYPYYYRVLWRLLSSYYYASVNLRPRNSAEYFLVAI